MISRLERSLHSASSLGLLPHNTVHSQSSRYRPGSGDFMENGSPSPFSPGLMRSGCGGPEWPRPS